MPSLTKVGVYVDVSNMYRCGGQKMRYDVLREFACRDGADPVRLNAYAYIDYERAEKDLEYKTGTFKFHAALRDMGYKVIVKGVKWFQDEFGRRVGKANADLDLAVDALLQSDNLDRVLIATGDGDFVQVIRALQNKGCRVEILGLQNASGDLRKEADFFMCGYLVPGLIPFEGDRNKSKWGDVGSRVRGMCYWFDAERGFGYMRFMKAVSTGLWITDTRNPDSPYRTAFFHEDMMKEKALFRDKLPSGNLVFEFDLGEGKDGSRAENIELACRMPGTG